jgi:hypothetical protein
VASNKKSPKDAHRNLLSISHATVDALNGKRRSANLRKVRQGEALRYAKIPNEVVREIRLSPNALKLTAYRLGRIGTFALNVIDVRKRGLMGKDAFHASIAEMKEAGILAREQQDRTAGSFGRAVESMLTRTIGPDSKDYIIVWDRLIILLPSQALACYLFIRARPLQVPTYSREVSKRFGWTAETTAKWLTWLIYNGLLKFESPKKSGRFVGTRYFALLVDETAIEKWSTRPGKPNRYPPDPETPDAVKCVRVSPAAGPPDTAPPGTYSGSDKSARHKGSSDDARTDGGLRLGYAEAATTGAVAGSIELASDGGALDWLAKYEQTAPQRAEWWRDAWPQKAELPPLQHRFPTRVLLYDVMNATDGRVARRLTTEAGLMGLRQLVGAVANMTGASQTDAYRFVINIISDRLSSPDKRLNSWSLIGHELFHAIREDVDLTRLTQDDDEVPF